MSIDSFEASRKRSDEIRADLPVHPGNYTMLTGDRPTGRLHLGHYFGTIRERVALQDMGVTTRVVIADYQVITDRDTTEHIADNVYNMVIDYLACGIDPEKTVIFTHSAVPALNQLMLPFLSLVTEAELQRNPTVKSEMEASGPRAHRTSAHLSDPPGVRHPFLQGQRSAGWQGPASISRDAPDRAPFQRALRQGLPRARRAAERRPGDSRA